MTPVPRTEIPDIEDAVTKFLGDLNARELAPETIRKYEHLLKGRLLHWCRISGHRQLRQLDVDAVREFRATWDDGALYASKNLERLRAFFRFCEQAEWISRNPARDIKAPRVKPEPTLPFTSEEMARILSACDSYRGDKARMRTFILTMRYSGLRIGDTLSLDRKCLKGSKLFLYSQKTGTPVSVPLPPMVVEALESLCGESPLFFISGRGKIQTARSNFSRYLTSIFKLAAIDGGHSHRFRDTFAVELLLAGVSLEQVSILLGHSSIKVTERHYSPWVKARQEQLEIAVQRTWGALESPALA